MESYSTTDTSIFRIGSILDRAFSTLSKNPGVFLGIAAISVIPTAIFEMLGETSGIFKLLS